MPTIKIIDAIKILMYFSDHAPPHFHAEYAEFEELIVIDTLETYSGFLPPRERRKVIEWARPNQRFLMIKWEELNTK